MDGFGILLVIIGIAFIIGGLCSKDKTNRTCCIFVGAITLVCSIIPGLSGWFDFLIIGGVIILAVVLKK